MVRIKWYCYCTPGKLNQPRNRTMLWNFRSDVLIRFFIWSGFFTKEWVGTSQKPSQKWNNCGGFVLGTKSIKGCAVFTSFFFNRSDVVPIDSLYERLRKSNKIRFHLEFFIQIPIAIGTAFNLSQPTFPIQAPVLNGFTDMIAFYGFGIFQVSNSSCYF